MRRRACPVCLWRGTPPPHATLARLHPHPQSLGYEGSSATRHTLIAPARWYLTFRDSAISRRNDSGNPVSTAELARLPDPVSGHLHAVFSQTIFPEFRTTIRLRPACYCEPAHLPGSCKGGSASSCGSVALCRRSRQSRAGRRIARRSDRGNKFATLLSPEFAPGRRVRQLG